MFEHIGESYTENINGFVIATERVSAGALRIAILRDGRSYVFEIGDKQGSGNVARLVTTYMEFIKMVVAPVLSATPHELACFVPSSQHIADFRAWLLSLDQKPTETGTGPTENGTIPGQKGQVLAHLEADQGVTEMESSGSIDPNIPSTVSVMERHFVLEYDKRPSEIDPEDLCKCREVDDYWESRTCNDWFVLQYSGPQIGIIVILDLDLTLRPGEAAFVPQTTEVTGSMLRGDLRAHVASGAVTVHQATIHVRQSIHGPRGASDG